MSKAKRVLVLGAAGMLGNAALRLFAHATSGYEALGSIRGSLEQSGLPKALSANVVSGIDVTNFDDVIRLFNVAKPDVVINCVGVVKQLDAAEDPLVALPINSILPHRLARLCQTAGARLVHISTDCVFAGTRGNYREGDVADAMDLYGRSKHLGEVDYPNAITLRTSIIGHELRTNHGLVGWFLSQPGEIKGYRKAIFSGLPTVELVRVIRDFVLPHPELHGLYHVSVSPISKYDLLALVAKTYGRKTAIHPDDAVKIDRSLNSARFRTATGYEPPTWPELVQQMHQFQ